MPNIYASAILNTGLKDKPVSPSRETSPDNIRQSQEIQHIDYPAVQEAHSLLRPINVETTP